MLRDVDWGVLAGARIGLLGAERRRQVDAAESARRHARAAARASGSPRSSCGSAISRSIRSSSCAPTNRRCGILRGSSPTTREQELRDYLGGFDFRGDMATSPVARFSGGEKARLTLALIVRQRPNLLLLDEPTNHLDIEMREALTEALQDYGGALIVVAHDRHLLRATTDELWLVADGQVDAVRRRPRRLSRVGARPRPARGGGRRQRASPASPSADRRAQKREEAQVRQRRADERKPLVSRQAAIEKDLERLTAEKTALDDWLATSDAYADDAKERLVARSRGRASSRGCSRGSSRSGSKCPRTSSD